MRAKNPELTVESRFTAAVSACAQAGVAVVYNEGAPCCRSCYSSDDTREVYALSQFGTLEFRDDQALYVETEDVECTCTEDEYDDDDVLISEGERCGVCTGYADSERETALPVGTLWFYFRELTSAQTLAAAMREQGFTVDWDGAESHAVAVELS